MKERRIIQNKNQNKINKIKRAKKGEGGRRQATPIFEAVSYHNNIKYLSRLKMNTACVKMLKSTIKTHCGKTNMCVHTHKQEWRFNTSRKKKKNKKIPARSFLVFPSFILSRRRKAQVYQLLNRCHNGQTAASSTSGIRPQQAPSSFL